MRFSPVSSGSALARCPVRRKQPEPRNELNLRSTEMSALAIDLVTSQAWRTLRWTCTAVFMALLDATILFVAFPSIRRSFAAVSTADLSWILNAYTVVYAALLVPAGRIADRVGRRRIFLQGVGLFTLGSLACGVAPTPVSIVAGRVLQAVGGAMLTPSSLALILTGFPRAKWPIAVSLWAAVGALAAAIGPSLGAAIIQLGGWRWAFFVNLPIGLVTLTRGRSEERRVGEECGSRWTAEHVEKKEEG